MQIKIMAKQLIPLFLLGMFTLASNTWAGNVVDSNTQGGVTLITVSVDVDGKTQTGNYLVDANDPATQQILSNATTAGQNSIDAALAANPNLTQAQQNLAGLQGIADYFQGAGITTSDGAARAEALSSFTGDSGATIGYSDAGDLAQQGLAMCGETCVLGQMAAAKLGVQTELFTSYDSTTKIGHVYLGDLSDLDNPIVANMNGGASGVYLLNTPPVAEASQANSAAETISDLVSQGTATLGSETTINLATDLGGGSSAGLLGGIGGTIVVAVGTSAANSANNVISMEVANGLNCISDLGDGTCSSYKGPDITSAIGSGLANDGKNILNILSNPAQATADFVDGVESGTGSAFTNLADHLATMSFPPQGLSADGTTNTVYMQYPNGEWGYATTNLLTKTSTGVDGAGMSYTGTILSNGNFEFTYANGASVIQAPNDNFYNLSTIVSGLGSGETFITPGALTNGGDPNASPIGSAAATAPGTIGANDAGSAGSPSQTGNANGGGTGNQSGSSTDQASTQPSLDCSVAGGNSGSPACVAAMTASHNAAEAAIAGSSAAVAAENTQANPFATGSSAGVNGTLPSLMTQEQIHALISGTSTTSGTLNGTPKIVDNTGGSGSTPNSQPDPSTTSIDEASYGDSAYGNSFINIFGTGFKSSDSVTVTCNGVQVTPVSVSSQTSGSIQVYFATPSSSSSCTVAVNGKAGPSAGVTIPGAPASTSGGTPTTTTAGNDPALCAVTNSCGSNVDPNLTGYSSSANETAANTPSSRTETIPTNGTYQVTNYFKDGTQITFTSTQDSNGNGGAPSIVPPDITINTPAPVIPGVTDPGEISSIPTPVNTQPDYFPPQFGADGSNPSDGCNPADSSCGGDYGQAFYSND